MKFVHDYHTNMFFNLSQVISIQNHKESCSIVMSDGSVARLPNAISTDHIDDVVVPAQPGFHVLYFIDEEGDKPATAIRSP